MSRNIAKYEVSVLTTVYPGSEKYFNRFLESISSQTNKLFELIIINDGFNSLNAYLKQYKTISFIVIDSNKSPAENRIAGINYCINAGFKIIIFADSDDYFNENRIDVICDVFKNNENIDIVVNEMDLVDTSGGIISDSYLSHRFSDMRLLIFDDIKYSNIMGLSNTAAKAKCFVELKIDPSLVAVDWYIFSMLLLNGCVAVFTNKTCTYYRQHENNIAGIKNITLESIKKSINVKNIHYNKLKSYRCDLNELSHYFSELSSQLDNQESLEQYYKECTLSLCEYPFWWEEALYLK